MHCKSISKIQTGAWAAAEICFMVAYRGEVLIQVWLQFNKK